MASGRAHRIGSQYTPRYAPGAPGAQNIARHGAVRGCLLYGGIAVRHDDGHAPFRRSSAPSPPRGWPDPGSAIARRTPARSRVKIDSWNAVCGAACDEVNGAAFDAACGATCGGARRVQKPQTVAQRWCRTAEGAPALPAGSEAPRRAGAACVRAHHPRSPTYGRISFRDARR